MINAEDAEENSTSGNPPKLIKAKHFSLFSF